MIQCTTSHGSPFARVSVVSRPFFSRASPELATIHSAPSWSKCSAPTRPAGKQHQVAEAESQPHAATERIAYGRAHRVRAAKRAGWDGFDCRAVTRNAKDPAALIDDPHRTQPVLGNGAG